MSDSQTAEHLRALAAQHVSERTETGADGIFGRKHWISGTEGKQEPDTQPHVACKNDYAVLIAARPAGSVRRRIEWCRLPLCSSICLGLHCSIEGRMTYA